MSFSMVFMPPVSDRHRNIAIAVALAGALVAVTAFGVAPPSASDVLMPERARVVEPMALDMAIPEPVAQFRQTETVRRGDTLSSILARLGANDPEVVRFASTDRLARRLQQMQTGRTVQAEVDHLGRVLHLTYRVGMTDESETHGGAIPVARVVHLRREGSRLVATEDQIALERSIETRSAEVLTSLFAATDAAGIPEAVAVKVADIFGGDLDMRRDLRRGARLRVVYETVRDAGSFDAPMLNRVLAAELHNGDRRHDAIWLDRMGGGEYVDFNGASRRKSFLVNPLEFSRVTSGFSGSRQHPIFGDWRAHRGVDFGAPIGTGVRASADGVIEQAGWNGGYGNMVVVRHNGSHSTVYAHLRDFPSWVRPGAHVAQGEVLGHVGATGWATGPHLHYELRLNGQPVDPMRVVTVPTGRPLDGAERQRLAARVSELREQMARYDNVQVARFQ